MRSHREAAVASHQTRVCCTPTQAQTALCRFSAPLLLRPHNRLGFAVQLALVRDLGRPLRSGETIPAAVLDTVADQIGIDPVVFELYARRDETRREHLAEIVAQLDLRHDAGARLPHVHPRGGDRCCRHGKG